jgi:hypothetical protein
MAIEVAELNEMQTNYMTAVDDWIEAIRTERALAAGNHSVAEVDLWEHAHDREEAARAKAKDAKKKYEAALRKEFFNF